MCSLYSSLTTSVFAMHIYFVIWSALFIKYHTNLLLHPEQRMLCFVRVLLFFLCVSFFLSFSIYFISCCWNFIHELPNSIFDEPNMFDISCVCCVLLHRGANKVCTLASIKSFHFISFIFVKSQNHWNWWNKMLHKSFEEEHWMVWWYFRRDSNHHRMLRFVYRGRER